MLLPNAANNQYIQTMGYLAIGLTDRIIKDSKREGSRVNKINMLH